MSGDLPLDESREDSVLGEKLVICAGLHRQAAIDHDDPIGDDRFTSWAKAALPTELEGVGRRGR